MGELFKNEQNLKHLFFLNRLFKQVSPDKNVLFFLSEKHIVLNHITKQFSNPKLYFNLQIKTIIYVKKSFFWYSQIRSCRLWRFDELGPTLAYAVCRLIYSYLPSPFQAIRTTQQLARGRMHQQPMGAEVLRRETYVNDVLSGGHSILEASAKQQSVTKLLKLGGFVIRKYLSKEPQVLSGVPSEDIASNSKSFSETENFSVLGLSWQPVENMFYFSIAKTAHSQVNQAYSLIKHIKIVRPFGLASTCSYHR